MRSNIITKSNGNSGKRWSEAEEKLMADLVRKNTPTRVIGMKLGRSESAVYNKARDLDMSLRPNNQPPYGTQKK